MNNLSIKICHDAMRIGINSIKKSEQRIEYEKQSIREAKGCIKDSKKLMKEIKNGPHTHS